MYCDVVMLLNCVIFRCVRLYKFEGLIVGLDIFIGRKWKVDDDVGWVGNMILVFEWIGERLGSFVIW